MTQHESLPLFTFATIPATSRPYATKANMAPGGSLELRLTVRYEGLKATQYFAKFTSESDKVFRDDLLALKLPHPRMEHTNLLSHGSVECFWESVQKDGALHQQLVNKALPSDKENQVILAENLKDLSIAKLTVKQLDYRNPNNSAAMRRQNPPSQYSPSSITKRPFPFGRSPNPVANPGLPPRPAPPKSHPEDVFRTSTNPYSLILDNAFPDRPSTPNPYYAKPPYGAPDITAPISPMKRPSSDWPGTARTTAGQSGPSSLKRPHAAISNVQQGQGSSSSKRLSSEMDWEDWQQLVSDKQKVLDWRSSNSVMDLNMGRPIKVAKTHAGSFELPKKPVVDVPPPNRAISPLPPRTAKLPKQPVVEQPPSQQASSVKTQASGPDPPLAAPSASVQKAPMSSTPSWPRADRVDDPRVTSQRRLSSGAVPSACAVAPTPTQKSVPLAPSTPAPSPIPALASTSRARTIVVPMRGGPRPAPRRPLAQVTREQTREIASASATTDVVVQSTPSTFKATLAPMSGPQPPIASTTIGGNAEAAPVKVPPVDLGHKRPHIEQADARALALKMATKAHEPPAPAPTTTTTPSSGSAPSRPVMPAQHPVASARVATTSYKPAPTIQLPQGLSITQPPTPPATVIAPPTPVSLTKPTPPPAVLASAASDASMSIRVKEEPIEVEMLPPWTSLIEPSAPVYIKEEVNTTSSLFLDSTATEKRTRPSRFAQLVEPSPLPTPPPSAESLHPTEATLTTATTPKRTSRFADKTMVQQTGPVAGPPGATTNLGDSVAQSSIVIAVPPSPPISSKSPPNDPESQPLPALLRDQTTERYAHEHTHAYESYEREHRNTAEEDTMARGIAKRTTKPYGSHQNNNHRREREDSSTRIQSLMRDSWSIKREITASLEREKDVIKELKSLDSKSIPAPSRLWDAKDDARVHDLRNRLNSAEGELEEEKRRVWVIDRALEQERELRFAVGRELLDASQRMMELERELKEEREKRQLAEDAIMDIRRECREPFVVPSLVDAYLQISKLTSRALKAAAERKAAEKAGVQAAPTAGGSGACDDCLMTGIDVQEVLSGTIMSTVLTTDRSSQANQELLAEEMDLSDS